MADDPSSSGTPDQSYAFGAGGDPYGGGMGMLGMLMGGGRGMGQDPYLAMLTPQLQYAQGLMARAADASPVASPWQAVARATSGVLGGMGMRDYGQATQNYLQQAAGERAAADQRVQGIYQGLAGTPPIQGAQAVPAQTAQAPQQFGDIVQNASKASGIPPHILVGLFNHESQFNPQAVNAQSGAAGLGQVLPSTAADPGFDLAPLSKADMLDPQKNATFSAQYLAARGKAMYGDKWDPTNTDQLRTALNGYGDGTPGYADAVLSKAGVAPTGAAAIAADPQQNAYHGLQAYYQLMQEATRRAQSYDPQLRATAPMLQAQALQLMNVGRYSTTTTPTGAVMTIDNLSGKPSTAVDAPRPDVWNQLQMDGIQKQLAAGQPLTMMQDSILRQAYGPKIDPQRGVTSYDHTPPAIVQKYLAGATAGGAQAAPGGGATAAPARTGAEIEASIARATDDYKADTDLTDKFVTESMSADQTLGVTQQIRSLLASGKVTPGHFATLQSAIGSIMAGAGYKPEEIAAKMSGWDQPTAELMTKFLTQLQMAKAREMGAREPGSVIQMFANNYPNWSSRPETIEAFTKSLDMQTLYDKARAQAMVDWTQQNRGNVEGYQRIGSSDFKKFFQERADPRVYQAAALAASPSKLGVDAQGNRTWQPIPSTEWAAGLSPPQKRAAATLAIQSFPGARVDWNGGMLTPQGP